MMLSTEKHDSVPKNLIKKIQRQSILNPDKTINQDDT